MAVDVLLVGPRIDDIFTENAFANALKSVNMVQEAFEGSGYLDSEENSCYSKCSDHDSSLGTASCDFPSEFCGKDELNSCENEDHCRKKRCSDRYDSAESSDR